MEYMSWVWLGAFILFVAIELITLGLTSVWFAVGALAACVVWLLGGGFIAQLLAFAVVTVLVLLLIRPYAIRYINGRTEKTNVDALIGKTAKVVAAIDNVNGAGMVVVDGVSWTARNVNDEVIEKDRLVTVAAVEGVKLIVQAQENKEEA